MRQNLNASLGSVAKIVGVKNFNLRLRVPLLGFRQRGSKPLAGRHLRKVDGGDETRENAAALRVLLLWCCLAATPLCLCVEERKLCSGGEERAKNIEQKQLVRSTVVSKDEDT